MPTFPGLGSPATCWRRSCCCTLTARHATGLDPIRETLEAGKPHNMEANAMEPARDTSMRAGRHHGDDVRIRRGQTGTLCTAPRRC